MEILLVALPKEILLFEKNLRRKCEELMGRIRAGLELVPDKILIRACKFCRLEVRHRGSEFILTSERRMFECVRKCCQDTKKVARDATSHFRDRDVYSVMKDLKSVRISQYHLQNPRYNSVEL